MPDGAVPRVRRATRPPAEQLNHAIDLARAGETDRAHATMRRLMDQLPDWDEPRLRLAESQRARGDPAAADAFRAVLAINPYRVQALLVLGVLLIEAGAPRDATKPLLRCCGLWPRNLDAWSTLGRAYMDSDEPRLALEALTRAQRLAPRSTALLHQVVSAAIAAGRGEAHVALLEVMCERDPLNPVPHLTRGLILDRLGSLDLAIDALETAMALAPGAREPIRLLAGVLSRSTRASQAEAAVRQALERDPTNPRLMNDHAAVLMRLHRHAEARDLLRQVLHRQGPLAPVVCNLANATVCLGLQDEAVELAQCAIALDGEALLPRRALANTLPYQDGVTGAALLRAARDCSRVLPRGSLPVLRRGDPGRALTIGLLSGTLRTHPVGWLTIAGFEHLDPSAFQIVCLSRAPEPADPIARRFHAVARSWENVAPLSDEALARRARELGIDIVIDLGGHGDAARMPACARRLAPVQVKWVGMQNHSTGLPEMGWFLTDRWETPPALETLYSEQMLRMPDGYVCYSPPPYAPDVVALPALRNKFVTFACFNNIAKITPRAIETWSSILQAVPGSRLILKTHQLNDAPTAARLRRAFDRFAIDPVRVETRGSSPHRAFMASYNEIDIVLDPFPYSGGLTTCEALWMGVPTVTLPGEIFASRHSASHLSNAGYSDWVARDLAGYVAMAVRWASDIDRLAALRETMRARVQASPLCDAPRFGRALGMALRHAWMNGETFVG
jgi:predicted O-linked N-acetylglucosamine transferase (SPINDLY family)